MKETLIQLLSTYGEPVLLQGTMDPNAAYPPSFFTIWNNAADDGAHYDDDAICFIWDFNVNFYSSDPSLVNTRLPLVRELLRSNGWIVEGVGYDVASDEPSHTGRSLRVYFRQNNTGGQK